MARQDINYSCGKIITSPYNEPADYLTGIIPSPIAPYGIQDRFAFRTGPLSVNAGVSKSGVFEFFGGNKISGDDLPNKTVSHATPPNRPWLIWGITMFLGQDKGSTFEFGAILQRTKTSGLTEIEIFAHAVDWHTDSVWETTITRWFTRPFYIPENVQLYYNYLYLNVGAAAANADTNMRLWWEFA